MSAKNILNTRDLRRIAHLVQLKEDARSGFIETVFVFLRALAPRRHVHVADFAGGWRFTVVANRPFLGAIRRRCWFLIFCNESKTLSFFFRVQSSHNKIKLSNGEIWYIEKLLKKYERLYIVLFIFPFCQLFKKIISIFKIPLNFIQHIYIMYSYVI